MILDEIRQLYPLLTRSQKRLADYIVNAYQDAAFMTASQLAKRLALNESTVIRFAQRLGYHGYPEMVRDIRELVKRELEQESGNAAAWDPFVGALGEVGEYLRRVSQHVIPESAHKVLELLREARCVYIFGQGVAAALAQAFACELRRIRLETVNLLADPPTLATLVSQAKPGDLLVAISAGKDSEQVANALQYANQRGLHTVALSTSPLAPCAQTAEVALCCTPSSEAPEAWLAPLVGVMDALVHVLSKENTEVRAEHALSTATAQAFILGKRRF